MFAGYVGRSYRHGQGLLLLGINPGGGGDADRYRTTEDEELYPLLADFKNAHSGGVVERFESANSCFARVVQRWNLWTIFLPTLAAAGRSIGDVAYMNVVPYRTRKNNTPPIAARRLAWARIVEPTIRLLAPQAIIALGKKADAVVQPLNKTDVKYFCVPRTNGDRYVSEKALGVLAGIRESLTLDSRLSQYKWRLP